MLAIEHFERAVQRFGDRPVVVHETGSITYRDMATLVDRIAAALVNSGVEPGARVSILSPNHPHVLACQYAIMKAGCVWVPSNHRNLPADTVRQFQTLGVEWLFHHSTLEEHAARAREEVAGIRGFVAIDRETQGAPALTEWIRHHPPLASFPEGRMDDPIAIMTTGGTTGLPKGAIHTNRSWEANIANFFATLSFRRPPVHLVVAPLTHATGVFHWTLVSRGATHVIAPSADPAVILGLIERHKVNVVFLPPTIIYMILAHSDLHRYDCSSLEYFMFGAAPMSVDKLREATRIFGPVMSQIYGSTETPIMNTVMRREELAECLENPALLHRLASAGREAPFSRVEIVDDAGHRLGLGQRGEIVVRGDFLMKEYYEDPKRTADAKVDGWFHSGDLGYKDEDGYVYIVDRKNDMIISGGFNVYPAEVEQTVLAHPAVQDCAVVGVPHEKWGEAVLAAVELKAGCALDEDEFFTFCKSRLGSVKAPKLLEIVDALPRSAVGKTLRRAVRARHWEGRGSVI
ncbi:class I adenylate-forming enzyme family protein [Azospirillum endophyticum]